ASAKTPRCALGADKLVKPHARHLELLAWFSLSRRDRLPRLALDLSSPGPPNPRHGPLTAVACALPAAKKVEVDGLPGPSRQPLLDDPLHDLLLVRVGNLGSVSHRAA